MLVEDRFWLDILITIWRVFRRFYRDGDRGGSSARYRAMECLEARGGVSRAVRLLRPLPAGLGLHHRAVSCGRAWANWRSCSSSSWVRCSRSSSSSRSCRKRDGDEAATRWIYVGQRHRCGASSCRQCRRRSPDAPAQARLGVDLPADRRIDETTPPAWLRDHQQPVAWPPGRSSASGFVRHRASRR